MLRVFFFRTVMVLTKLLTKNDSVRRCFPSFTPISRQTQQPFHLVSGFARLANSLSDVSGHFVTLAKPPKCLHPHFCQPAKPPKGLHPPLCHRDKASERATPLILSACKVSKKSAPLSLSGRQSLKDRILHTLPH